MIDPTPFLPLVVLALLPAPPVRSVAPPSDQVGVYALIERVEFLPSREKATSVKIFGAFAVAEAKNGDYYRSPRWGCLSYHLEAKKEKECRDQWSDLASVAGTDTIVGFGFRYYQSDVRVHAVDVKNAPSVPFQTGMGVQKNRNANYGPLMQLRCLPKPRSPVAGDAVKCPGGPRPEMDIELTVDNCIDDIEGIRYLFEIERPNGDIRASEPIAAGNKRTSWKTSVAFTVGEKVKWRCRVLRKGLVAAPVATAEFVTVTTAGGDGQGR